MRMSPCGGSGRMYRQPCNLLSRDLRTDQLVMRAVVGLLQCPTSAKAQLPTSVVYEHVALQLGTLCPTAKPCQGAQGRFGDPNRKAVAHSRSRADLPVVHTNTTNTAYGPMRSTHQRTPPACRAGRPLHTHAYPCTPVRIPVDPPPARPPHARPSTTLRVHRADPRRARAAHSCARAQPSPPALTPAPPAPPPASAARLPPPPPVYRCPPVPRTA